MQGGEVGEVYVVVGVEVEEAAAGVGDSGRVAGEAALEDGEVAQRGVLELHADLSLQRDEDTFFRRAVGWYS